MRTRFISPLLALAFAALVATPSLAQAQGRNWYAGGGLGVTFALDDGAGALFALNEEVGYQLDPILLGDAADLALRFGLDLGQQFGDITLLTFGARVTASFGVWEGNGMAVRVAPSIVLGGAVSIVEACVFGVCESRSNGAFNFQFATQGELDLLDGLLTVWFRPLAIDVFANDGTAARWNLLAGALVHF